jgi:NAD-dependent SIR2 family protein deacetylase
MVYNVVTKDFRMGEYDTALKKMHRYDSLKKEIDGLQNLLLKLVEEPDYDSNYAAHMTTGVVYDLRIIRQNVDRLHKELDDVSDYNS